MVTMINDMVKVVDTVLLSNLMANLVEPVILTATQGSFCK